MTRMLIVGDVHAVAEELRDCEALMGLIETRAVQDRAEVIVFLGDLHHSFATVRCEVTEFYQSWFSRLPGTKFLLRGNHDRSIDARVGAHALMSYRHMLGVVVVDEPLTLDGILMLPHYFESESFLEACRLYPTASLVLCHQDFSAVQYENGFFSKTGVDPAAVPQPAIIGGHIHRPGEYGKLWLPGAPRWRSADDANVDRHIWFLEVESGHILSRSAIPTDTACSRLVRIEESEAQPHGADLNPAWRYIVDCHGSPAFLESRREFWGQRVRLRAFPEALAAPEGVRESQGIGLALRTYARAYQGRYGTPGETLVRLVEERIA